MITINRHTVHITHIFCDREIDELYLTKLYKFCSEEDVEDIMRFMYRNNMRYTMCRFCNSTAIDIFSQSWIDSRECGNPICQREIYNDTMMKITILNIYRRLLNGTTESFEIYDECSENVELVYWNIVLLFYNFPILVSAIKKKIDIYVNGECMARNNYFVIPYIFNPRFSFIKSNSERIRRIMFECDNIESFYTNEESKIYIDIFSLLDTRFSNSRLISILKNRIFFTYIDRSDIEDESLLIQTNNIYCFDQDNPFFMLVAIDTGIKERFYVSL